MTRANFSFPLACLLLAACSGGEQEQAQPSPSPETSPAALPAQSASPEMPLRISTYTSLDDCPVLRSNPDEGGFYESECPGEAGYKLRVTESDLRQTVAVIAPDGASHGLRLSSVSGGGFSELGDTVEWRGTTKGGVFVPDALVLRHEVVTDPEGEKEVSYLVAVRLAGTPCAVARIAPGPGQNEKARAAADAGGKCLAASA